MDGGTINLYTSEAAGGMQSVDMALMMKENAAKIGFDLNFVREPTDGYWANIWLKRDYPIRGSNWMPRPTADLRFSLVYISGVKWNEGFWSHEKFDSLITEARGTKDGPERKELYCAAQQIMWDEGAPSSRCSPTGSMRGPPTSAGTANTRSVRATASASTSGAT